MTSPSPENLKTLFEFLFKGFDALGYQEHLDFTLVQSTNPEFNKAIVRVNIFREHRQTVQYIHPADAARLAQAELLVIDEAAAIPLPLVKALLGPYLVFLASTINVHEGTGRSLSLKLIKQLREQAAGVSGEAAGGVAGAPSGRSSEATLRSRSGTAGDPPRPGCTRSLSRRPRRWRARWASAGARKPPAPTAWLYHVNRDTLFSYHRASRRSCSSLSPSSLRATTRTRRTTAAE